MATKADEKPAFVVEDFISTGPAPDQLRRQLVFDSLHKVIDNRAYNRALAKSAATEQKEDRGTFVYTWGAGYHGQLGRKGARGQKKYATVPLMVELIKATRQVACGGLHTVSLTDKGEVFAWGDGTKGQLGNLDVGYSSLMTPHPVDKLGRQVIKQISCGQRHTVGVTDQGRMYAWGEGKSGQTGLGSRNMERFPIAVDCEVRPGADSFFTQVACGDKHTVALTRKGFVYTFGCGEHGQLGHGNQADQTKPTLVEEFVAHGVSVYSIATGAVHSVAVSDSGQLFVWGFGEYFYRQGGKNFYYTPQQVEFKGKIVQAACGQGHMLVLTDKGDVWTWGSGEYGQLGHGDTASNRVPRVVLENKFVAQISAGRYHSVALASNGALYTWGCGENGQLGHNSDENELIPRVVEGILSNVVGQVACGEHHTAALTSVPYNSLNAEVAEWLMMEKEEYSEKKKHVVDTRKALTRKDLLAIRQKVLAKFGVEENKLGDDLDLTPEQLEARAAKKASAASLRLAASLAAANAAMSAPKPQASPTAGQASNVALGPDGQPLLGPDGQPLPAGPYLVNGVEVPNSALSPEGFLIDIATGEKLLNPEGQPMVPDNTSLSSTLTKEDMSETNLLSRTQHHREAAAPLKTMIQVLQEAVTQGSTPAEQINAAFAQLVASRKEHDHFKAISLAREQELKHLTNELESLEFAFEASATGDKSLKKRIHDLEMQLDTVNIKIAETEDTRRNYELNISNLQEEEMAYLRDLDALRRTNTENVNLFRKMNALKAAALHDRAAAESEKEMFAHELSEYRSFLDQQRQMFVAVTDTVIQNCHTRELEKERKEEAIRQKASGRIEKLRSLVREKEAESEQLQAKLVELNKSVKIYEESFQQVAIATGLTEPDEIINKFYLKEEIRTELNRELAVKTKKLDDLKIKYTQRVADLQVARDTFTDSKWRDVASVQESLRDITVTNETNRQKTDEKGKELAVLQQGLTAIVQRVNRALGHSDSLPTTSDFSAATINKLMQLVEYSLDQLASATQKGASAEHLLGTVPDGPSNGAAADKGAAATSKTAGKTTRK